MSTKRAESLTIPPLSIHEIPSLRRINLWTQRHATSDLSGAFHSRFRGTGLEFRDLREYVPGDEIKHIHWRATARSGRAYVKTYDEERSHRVHIALDCSTSMYFQNRFRSYQRTACLIARLAQRSGDKLSLSLFAGDTIEYVSASKGHSDASRIIRQLCSISTLTHETDLARHCAYLSEKLSQRSVVVILSDFCCPPFREQLLKLSNRHQPILATLSLPPFVPRCGIVQWKDAETGELLSIDTDEPQYEASVRTLHEEHLGRIRKITEELRGAFLPIGDSIVRSLLHFSKAKR